MEHEDRPSTDNVTNKQGESQGRDGGDEEYRSEVVDTRYEYRKRHKRRIDLRNSQCEATTKVEAYKSMGRCQNGVQRTRRRIRETLQASETGQEAIVAQE